LNWPGLHLRTACVFRFSQPLDAFFRFEPAGLVSCRIRSRVHPPKLSSSNAAVRCFQRRSPLGVPTAFRVLLRAGIRHSVQRFRLNTERVAPLGLFPSRVLSLSALVRPSPDLPSCGCLLGRKRPSSLHFRVSHAERSARLSRDRRPSWGLWPPGRHACSSIDGILESPPKAPGVRHRPPLSLSSNPTLLCRSQTSLAHGVSYSNGFPTILTFRARFQRPPHGLSPSTESPRAATGTPSFRIRCVQSSRALSHLAVGPGQVGQRVLRHKYDRRVSHGANDPELLRPDIIGFLRPAEAPGTFGPFAQTPALLICGPEGPTEPDCVSIK
jgi:hypothetical protein